MSVGVQYSTGVTSLDKVGALLVTNLSITGIDTNDASLACQISARTRIAESVPTGRPVHAVYSVSVPALALLVVAPAG